MLERTLVIIKPDGMQKNLAGTVLERFANAGLSLAACKMIQLTEALLREHYDFLTEKPFFPSILSFMQESPVLVAVLKGENAIEVVLGLACSPNEIKGRVKLTKKEAEIASELQKMWDNNSKYGCFFDSDKFKKKAEELSALTHHLECYREFYFDFGMDDFYQKIDLLSQTYVFDGLTDNAIEASTRDLIPVKELFGKTE